MEKYCYFVQSKICMQYIVLLTCAMSLYTGWFRLRYYMKRSQFPCACIGDSTGDPRHFSMTAALRITPEPSPALKAVQCIAWLFVLKSVVCCRIVRVTCGTCTRWSLSGSYRNTQLLSAASQSTHLRYVDDMLNVLTLLQYTKVVTHCEVQD